MKRDTDIVWGEISGFVFSSGKYFGNNYSNLLQKNNAGHNIKYQAHAINVPYFNCI